jgi:hypothetical protein
MYRELFSLLGAIYIGGSVCMYIYIYLFIYLFISDRHCLLKLHVPVEHNFQFSYQHHYLHVSSQFAPSRIDKMKLYTTKSGMFP